MDPKYIWSASGESRTVPLTLIPFDLLLVKIQESAGDGGVLVLKGLMYLAQFAALYFLFGRQSRALDRPGNRFRATLLVTIVMTGLFSTSPFGPRQAAYLFWTVIACVTPYGLLAWAIPACCAAIAWGLGGELMTTSFIERGFMNLASYEFAGSMLLVSLVILSARRAKPKLILPAVIVSILAATSGALAPFCLIGAGLLCSAVWGASSETDDPILVGVTRLQNTLQGLPPVGVVWLLGCVCFVNYSRLARGVHVTSELFFKNEIDAYLDNTQKVPDDASSAGHLSRIFANPELSSYLLFRFADANGNPERLVIADAESARYATGDYSAAIAASNGDPRAMEILERYQVSTVLCRADGPLCGWLSEQSAWKLVPLTSLPTSSPASPTGTTIPKENADPEQTSKPPVAHDRIPGLLAFERVR